MRQMAAKALILISVFTTLGLSLPNDPPALRPYAGTGMFLMLSDIHFDPYGDPAIMQELGATLRDGCQVPAAQSFSRLGSDTNYPLFKSALDQIAAAAAQNHFHYDYVMVTGDLLAHGFDGRYRQCVGGGDVAYQQFASSTISLVHSMISKALPGVPIFAALGNNDTDRGDYAEASGAFRQNLGRDWSQGWGSLPAATRTRALASFIKAGNYALPHPTVPRNELVVLNSNLWAARNDKACSETDPDPGGQFQWLADILGAVRHSGRTATLVMHIVPGIDALRSSTGEPRSFWTDRCTEKLIAQLSDFRGVVSEMYAGHIHRDDFRLFPDREGRPLCTIHIIPALSPVYFDNPAIEIGWYDKSNGQLRDYASLYLDLGNPQPAWATEYVFSRAYGVPRPDLAALEELVRAIHAGGPNSGVGKQYASYYAVGVGMFLTPDNWSDYSCAQRELNASHFAQCRRAEAGR